jgi:tetratricopeptide (TPR) repeat protein
MTSIIRSGVVALLAVIICLVPQNNACGFESNKRAAKVLNKAKAYLFGPDVSIEDAVLWFDEVSKYYPNTKEGAEASANKIAACGALAQSFLQSRARALEVVNQTSDDERTIRICGNAAWDYADALWDEYKVFLNRYSERADDIEQPHFPLGNLDAEGFVLYFNRVFGLVPSNNRISMSSLHMTVGNLFFFLGDDDKARFAYEKVLSTQEKNNFLLRGMAGTKLAELREFNSSPSRNFLQSLKMALNSLQWFANDYGRNSPELEQMREVTDVAAQVEPLVDFVAMTLDSDIEIDVGRAAARKIELQFSAYEVPDMTNIGLSVAGASDKPDLPYRFKILRTDQPNAFAFPGGIIYVTEGLLNDIINIGIDSKDRLACVIGHEITHVVHRDGFHNLQRRIGFAVFKEMALNTSKKSGSDKQESIELLADFLVETVSLGYGRKAEFRADLEGVEAAYRAGYNPQAMVSVLQALGKHENPDIMPWLRTHPPAADRVNAVQRKIAQLR